jgi:GAF domain-containing protein
VRVPLGAFVAFLYGLTADARDTEDVSTADVESSLERLAAETTVSRLLQATGVELVELLDVSRCSISRVIGDLLVELSDHLRSGETRPLELFLVSDYPLTQEVIEAGEPRVVLRSDPDADPAEAELLGRIGFDSLLMLPLRSRGQNWGLIEIYADDSFSELQIQIAITVAERVGALLAELEGNPYPVARRTTP